MVRRQKRFYFVGALLAVILIVNVLFFVIVFNKARSEYSRLDASINEEQMAIKAKTARVETLQKTADALENFGSDRTDFQQRHLVKRQTGFAEVLRTLDRLAQNAGVKKTRVEYGVPSAIPQFGLYQVKIKIPVQGDYASIFKFVKELQSTPTVFIISSVDVHGASTADDVEEATISLSLAMETYFYDERS